MKINTGAMFTVSALMLALTGCFDSGSDSSTAASGLSVKTASGGTATLTGPYKTACFAEDRASDGTDDGVIESIAFTDSTWTYTSSVYADDTSCANTPDVTTIVANVTPVGEQTVVSWEDGFSPITAPTGLDSATYSTFMLEVTSSNDVDVSAGFQIGFGYVVDDSSSSGLTVYSVSLTDNIASTDGSYSNTIPSTGDTTGAGATFTATAASGNTVELAGPYKTVCYGNPDGQIDSVTLTGSTWTNIASTYAGDANCANAATTTVTIVADISASAEQTLNGWANGNNETVTAPTGLTDTASYTSFTIDVTSSDHPNVAVGYQTTMAYVIDDSSTAGLTLYRFGDASTGIASTADPQSDIPASATPATAADLQISIDSVANSSGFNADVTYTVTNVGGTDAGSFNVMVWGQRAVAPDSYTVAQSGAFDSHTGLAAGASVTMTATASGTWFAGDAFDAYVIVDFFESVTEQDEGLTGTNDNLSHLSWTAQ